jgi:hypothetical protein
VYEHIIATAVGAYKAKPLVGIEEFDCTRWHCLPHQLQDGSNM